MQWRLECTEPDVADAPRAHDSGDATKYGPPPDFVTVYPAAERPDARSLFFSTAIATRLLGELLADRAANRTGADGPALRLVDPAETRRLLGRLKVRRLGYCRSANPTFVPLEAQLAALRSKDGAPDHPLDCLTVALISPFGAAFGDSVLFLTLIREVRRQLARVARTVEIDLFHDPVEAEHDWPYVSSGVIRALYTMPQPLRLLANYDAYFDFTEERIRAELPWIDGLLEAAAIPPETIPAVRKRNAVVVDAAADRDVRSALSHLRASGRRLLLFNPTAAATIRSMPTRTAVRVLDALLRQTDYTVLPTSRIDTEGVVPVDDDRLVYLPEIFERTYQHFVAAVASADAFISVDTSLYHLADACQVPGVVLFTTHRPDHWVRYYPLSEGIQLTPDDRLQGLHFSDRPEDIAYVAGLWDHLDVDNLLSRLDRAVQRAVGWQRPSDQ